MAKTTKTKYQYELMEVNVDMANLYLRVAYDTICNIQKDDNYVCELIDIDDEDDGDDDSKYKIYERNYIITLASLFSDNNVKRNHNAITGSINGEVAKKLKLPEYNDTAYFEKYIEKKALSEKKEKPCSSRKERKQVHVFPDFLIHEKNSFDPSNMSRNTQHLIMEAKTTKIKDEMKFWFDFLKLNFYIEKLQFDNAVYFILGTSLSNINTYIQNYMDDENVVYCGDEINRLFFIVQEKLKNTPKLYQIKKTII